jgi:hypothetical protein
VTTPGRFIGGRALVMQDFHAFDFKDEFESIRPIFMDFLGSRSQGEFERLAAETLPPARRRGARTASIRRRWRMRSPLPWTRNMWRRSALTPEQGSWRPGPSASR